jgi:hypothetical protein
MGRQTVQNLCHEFHRDWRLVFAMRLAARCACSVSGGARVVGFLVALSPAEVFRLWDIVDSLVGMRILRGMICLTKLT